MGSISSAMAKHLAAARRWLALAAALALAACSGAVEPAPTDPAPNKRAQPRVVSLNPCVDAMLVEIAAPGQILALSHYSRDPSSSSIPQQVASRFAVTGGTVEEVLALEPDVILASSFLPQPTRTALERAGLRVETFRSPTTVDESIAQARRVAEIAGRGPEGEWLVRDIRRAAEPRAGVRPVSTLLWQPGEIVPGEATLVAEMLRARGFVSHAAEMGLGQADFVPLEAVLAHPPELLLVAGDSAGQSHPLLARLRDTRVASFDPRLLYCGGRTIAALGMRLDEIRAELGR